MKTTYYKNIPIARGEITIVKNENANTIMKHSCSLARSIQTSGLGVLVVNTGLSRGRFMEAATETGLEWMAKRSTALEDKTSVAYYTSHSGNLVEEMDKVGDTCRDCDISVVIITSWEWSSSSWRRKERLLFALRDLMADNPDLSVIIYSQSTTATTVGCFDRGGTGKLATVAFAVISIATSQVLEEFAPKEKLFVGTLEEHELFKESAQLLQKEINKLEGITLSSGTGRKTQMETDDDEGGILMAA